MSSRIAREVFGRSTALADQSDSFVTVFVVSTNDKNMSTSRGQRITERTPERARPPDYHCSQSVEAKHFT
jgi:hypothetical protein